MIDLTAVESIFFAALEKPSGEEQALFLNAVCGDNADLRKHVERMLVAHPRAAGFLNGAGPGVATTLDEPPITERPGALIGPYKLMEQIGEGGFGLVFVAEQQQPLRRKVALKIIKPGMDSRDVIARFEAERQALALMDHPNIAKVLDAGTTETSRPYFVMELVKGISIVEYCDQQQLTARERLELFLSVCQAVQHAHGKGIIHRDLKPSNILVAPHDGVPVVKVIDFGVAKALGQQLTDKTIYTRFAQMIGTPLYMSPEQAEINALDVDIRSDVYSLGVLLYELLTGTTPFDRRRFATAAYDEIRRIIREEEPPKPSTRLGTLGEALSAVSSRRKTEPGKLSALVRGDLDWMAMKALEKDRTRRYETASAFAADVRHFLNQEPVEARPPSAWYRFGKLARRNKMALTTAALVAGALLLGTVGSTWQALRATKAEQVAQLNEAAAQDQKHEADDAKENAERQRDELAALNEKLRRAIYIADMNLAQHAWDENNLVRVRELLDRHRPKPGEMDLRNFEWHYHRRQLEGDVFTVKAHVGPVLTAVYTSDGKRLLTLGSSRSLKKDNLADTSGELKLWDAATREPLPLTLKGSTEKVIAIALGPDGKTLAAGCRDKTIKIWDLDTGKLLYTLDGHEQEFVGRVGFSPDGKQLVSLASPPHEFKIRLEKSTEIRIWDLSAGKLIRAIDKLPFIAASPVFSTDGKHVAAALVDGKAVKVWDAVTGREVCSFTDAGEELFSMALSPNGKLVAAGSLKSVTIWDANTRQIVQRWQRESSLGLCLAFSPDSRRLASGNIDGALELRDAATGKPVPSFKGHAGYVSTIAFSPDGKYLASAGLDGKLRVWATAGKHDTISIPALDLSQEYMVLSPDGRTVLSGAAGKRIQFWDAATGRLRNASKEPVDAVAVDISADGKLFAMADAHKNITLWDLTSGEAIRTFEAHSESITALSISLDRKWLAVAGQEGTLKLWDLKEGAESRTIKGLKKNLYILDFSQSPAGLGGESMKTRLFPWLGDNQDAVTTLDMATGREIRTTKLSDISVRFMGLSPQGRLLAVAGHDSRLQTGEVRILNAETGRELIPALRGHTLDVTWLAFSPDGQRLATASWDKTVKVWDLRTGQEVLTLKGHTHFVTSVAFSPDGRRLISVSADRTVRVWNAVPVSE